LVDLDSLGGRSEGFTLAGIKGLKETIDKMDDNGESGRRRTRFRSEAEQHSVVNPNSIPV
jgi:hypothetical protein